MVCVVGICLYLPSCQRVPRDAEIGAALVLHPRAALPEAVSVHCGVAIAIEVLVEHQRESAAESQAGGVGRGPVSMVIDGCLAAERYAMMRVGVVDAGVEEVAAVGEVPAIECLRLWLQGSVQLCEDCGGSQSDGAAVECQVSAGGCLVGVAFLRHLRGSAVVAVGDDGLRRAVAGQCSI